MHLCVVHRSRIAVLAGTAISACLLPVPAVAQLNYKEIALCNKGSEKTVHAAITYDAAGSWMNWSGEWTSSGWYRIQPGQCWRSKSYAYDTSHFYVTFSVESKGGWFSRAFSGVPHVRPGDEYLLGSNHVWCAASTSTRIR
ncbi:MAG: DUF1036 domain-containing protein [Bryobacteraceae bacterium]|nr:DUF1036 domain-containing protein [Bryobacteraceae bacterium]